MKSSKVLFLCFTMFVCAGSHSTASDPQTNKNDQCSSAVLITKDITPPVLIKRINPSLPKAALTKERTSSPIIVEAVVTTDGSVACAKIIKPGDAELGAAILEAISKSKYKPALKDGKPLPIRFTIKTKIGVRE